MSHLLRWHYAVPGGASASQLALQGWLANRAVDATATARPEIQALVFCSEFSRIKEEQSIREFLQAGADVRMVSLRSTFRMINVGSRLLVALNPAEPTERLVTDAIYYDAQGDDDLIGMLRDMFHSAFAGADRLVWDARKSQVRKANRLRPFVRELRALFSPAHVVYRITWVLLGAGLMFGIGYLIRALAG